MEARHNLQPDPGAMELFATLDTEFFDGQFAREKLWRVWVVDLLGKFKTSDIRLYDGPEHRRSLSPDDRRYAALQFASGIWVSKWGVNAGRTRRLLLHEMAHAEVERHSIPSTPIELEYLKMRDAGYPHDPRFIGELTRLTLRGEAWAAEDAARYSLENVRRMFGLEPIEGTLRRALRRTDADLKARAEAV